VPQTGPSIQDIQGCRDLGDRQDLPANPGASGALSPNLSRPILLVSHEFPPFHGGMASYARDLAATASRLGYSIRICAPCYPELDQGDGDGADGNRDERDRDERDRDERDRADVKRILRHHAVSVPTILALGREIRRFPADGLIHACDVRSTVLCALWARVWNRNYMIAIHGSEVLKMSRRPRLAAVLRPFYAAAEIVVANSTATANLFRKAFGPAPPACRVAHLGVDPEWFAAPPATFTHPDLRRLDPRRPVVSTVGRLDDRKGHLMAIDALSRLDRIKPIYAVAGAIVDQAYADRVRAYAREKEVDLRLLGRVSGDDLKKLYAVSAAHILCAQPARDKIEGFGFVVLEAGAQGCPTIGTRVGGVPELIRDGETGHLCPPGDAAAAARALERLLTNPADRRKMSAQAKAHARSFTWEATVAATFGDRKALQSAGPATAAGPGAGDVH